MSQITGAEQDIFAFGGDEELVLNIQRPFAQRFGRDAVVVDLGCGRGTFLELLRQQGAHGIGVDMSSQSVEICRRKGFAEVVQGDGLSFLSDKYQAFDGIFCSHIIEHLGPEQANKLIELSYQALKPGGQLIMLTPNPNDLQVIGETFWLDPTHVRPYPLLLLQDWFTKIGFRVIETRQFTGIPLLKQGKRRLVRNVLLKILLGRYYGAANSLIIGQRAAD